MATLDDKLLGEKLHYYCSSSEDEDDAGDAPSQSSAVPQPTLDGSSGNTGPKGVIKDWQRFKQLETEKRAEADQEKLALAKKLNMSCKTEREEAEEKARDLRIEEEMDNILNDDFMKDYMQKRMQEMMTSTKSTKIFGEMIDLLNGEHFLEAVDNEDKGCTVIVLIHEPTVPGCHAMLQCIRCLARDYKTVKFCQIIGSAAGLSKHFKVSGVPALLAYRGGQLISNFVRMTDQFGEDFFANEVESFLLEHGLLYDKEDVPKIIRGAANQDDDQEDDWRVCDSHSEK